MRGTSGVQVGVGGEGGDQVVAGRERGGLERAFGGVVAAEVRGIDDDAADLARQAEADDAPVITGLAAAAGLPAVHPFAAVGVFVLLPHGRVRAQEVVLLGEELVVAEDRGAAVFLGGEVDACGPVVVVAHAGSGGGLAKVLAERARQVLEGSAVPHSLAAEVGALDHAEQTPPA
jgi:hypothetical protein